MLVKCDLLIDLVQARSGTGVRDAAAFVFLKIPVVNDEHKARKGERKFKQGEQLATASTCGKTCRYENIMVIIIR